MLPLMCPKPIEVSRHCSGFYPSAALGWETYVETLFSECQGTVPVTIHLWRALRSGIEIRPGPRSVSSNLQLAHSSRVQTCLMHVLEYEPRQWYCSQRPHREKGRRTRDRAFLKSQGYILRKISPVCKGMNATSPGCMVKRAFALFFQQHAVELRCNHVILWWRT